MKFLFYVGGKQTVKNNLRDKLEDCIDEYNLIVVNKHGDKEELAPANVEVDLIDDLIQIVLDEVSEFILKDN
ncbi:hypothetical protein A3SAC12_0035 [Lactobacillus phage 3-SAC12]|nr:hypothetical protein A3SAC12_0035 [Lactobacillus phage 3-SAC12]